VTDRAAVRCRRGTTTVVAQDAAADVDAAAMQVLARYRSTRVVAVQGAVEADVRTRVERPDVGDAAAAVPHRISASETSLRCSCCSRVYSTLWS